MQCLEYLFKATLVPLSIVGWFWLVGKWHSRELVFVMRIFQILYVFEDRVENLHSFGVEEANLGDETLKS